jgi:prefoldin subunit 5
MFGTPFPAGWADAIAAVLERAEEAGDLEDRIVELEQALEEAEGAVTYHEEEADQLRAQVDALTSGAAVPRKAARR